MTNFKGEDIDAGKFFPDDHKFAMKVTKGGSSCSNCKWLSSDGYGCDNEYFRKWQTEVEGKDDPESYGVLPEPAEEYCCDLWHS